MNFCDAAVEVVEARFLRQRFHNCVLNDSVLCAVPTDLARCCSFSYKVRPARMMQTELLEVRSVFIAAAGTLSRAFRIAKRARGAGIHHRL
jgi:hypothetical protein